MSKVNVVFLIDIQNGFSDNSLTLEQGGCLYVPDGESVGKPAANLIQRLDNSVFVLSQDYHPKNHISFASNHKYKKPMDEIILIDNNGNQYAQTLWDNHCGQNTKSCLFVDEIMEVLPEDLVETLKKHDNQQSIYSKGNHGNEFYVVRKGINSDLDSYAICVENDRITKTVALEVFAKIANDLKSKGVMEVVVSIGGLATNFCLEFSSNDVKKFFIPLLEEKGIKVKMQFLRDVSRGIPISVPNGEWPDLDSSEKRMGNKVTTTENLLRESIVRNYSRISESYVSK